MSTHRSQKSVRRRLYEENRRKQPTKAESSSESDTKSRNTTERKASSAHPFFQYSRMVVPTLIVLLALLLYLPLRDHELVLDDQINIVQNPFITAIGDEVTLGDQFQQLDPKGYYTDKQRYPSYRPLVMATWLIDYALGNGDAWMFHLTSILLHILVSLAVFFFLLRILPNSWVPAIAAVLYTVHPLAVETLTVASFRGDQLAFLFILLALIFYVNHRERVSSFRLPSLIASLVCFLLALFSKETAFVFLPLLLLLDLAVPYPVSYKADGGDAFGFLAMLKRSRTAYLAFVVVTLFFIFVRFVWLVPDPPDNLMVSYPMEQQPAGLVFFTQILITLNYLGWMVFPVVQSSDHYIPWSTQASAGLIILGILVLLTLLTVAILAYRKQKRLFFFGILWVFITLIPVSNIVPIPGQAIAERYLYMPLLGFTLVVAALLVWIFRLKTTKPWSYQAVVLLFPILLTVVYGMKSMEHVSHWETDQTLAFYEVTLVSSPVGEHVTNIIEKYTDQKPTPATVSNAQDGKKLLDFGIMLLADPRSSEIRLDDSQHILQASRNLDPQNPRVYYQLGKVHYLRGNMAAAKAVLEHGLKLRPNYEAAQVLLREVLRKLNG
jgi:protein O-mannosyl-transferase